MLNAKVTITFVHLNKSFPLFPSTFCPTCTKHAVSYNMTITWTYGYVRFTETCVNFHRNNCYDNKFICKSISNKAGATSNFSQMELRSKGHKKVTRNPQINLAVIQVRTILSRLDKGVNSFSWRRLAYQKSPQTIDKISFTVMFYYNEYKDRLNKKYIFGSQTNF